MNKELKTLIQVISVLVGLATLFTVVALIITTLVTIFGANNFLFNLKQGYVIGPSVAVFAISVVMYAVALNDKD